MFILRCVTPYAIHERWVLVYYALITQVFQGAQVILLLPPRLVYREGATIRALQPPSAEGQSAECLIDVPQQFLRFGEAQWHMARVEGFHVVATLAPFDNVSFACGPEGFYRIHLTFHHASGIVVLDDGHALASVNLITADAMTIEVATALHGVHFTIEFYFMRLHDLLDLFSYFAHLDIDSGQADARLRGLTHGMQQRIIPGIEGHGPRTVDDATVDLTAEVHLHDIVLAQHRVVPTVGGVVRGDMVYRAARRKARASLQACLLKKRPIRLLQLLAHIDETDAGLDEGLRVRTDLWEK